MTYTVNCEYLDLDGVHDLSAGCVTLSVHPDRGGVLNMIVQRRWQMSGFAYRYVWTVEVLFSQSPGYLSAHNTFNAAFLAAMRRAERFDNGGSTNAQIRALERRTRRHAVAA